MVRCHPVAGCIKFTVEAKHGLFVSSLTLVNSSRSAALKAKLESLLSPPAGLCHFHEDISITVQVL